MVGINSELATGGAGAVHLRDLPEDNPFLRHMGVDIETWSRGRVVVRLPIAAHHLNRSGIVHGGVYTVLCDTAGGLAGCYADPGQPRVFAYTVSLTTQFVGKAAAGCLWAEGRVERSGRQIYFSSVQVRSDAGLVALGQGSFMLAERLNLTERAVARDG